VVLTAKSAFRGGGGPLLIPPDVEYRLGPWSYVLQTISELCCVYSPLQTQFPNQKFSPIGSFLAEFGLYEYFAHTALTNRQKK